MSLGFWVVLVRTGISLYGSLYRVLFHTFTVTLAGLKNIVRYSGDFVMKEFIASGPTVF